MKFWKLASALSVMILSFSVNAAIIDNGMYTTDTDSGFDWLDLTATSNRSYNDISSQLGVGGEFEGWRYASMTQVAGFFDAFGGNNTAYNLGWTQTNNGLFSAVAQYWGDLYGEYAGYSPGHGYSHFMTRETNTDYTHNVGLIYDHFTNQFSPTSDLVLIRNDRFTAEMAQAVAGHALIRDTTVVPIPAALWLFGSGLIGLVGFARRKGNS